MAKLMQWWKGGLIEITFEPGDSSSKAETIFRGDFDGYFLSSPPGGQVEITIGNVHSIPANGFLDL
ncbi:MAG: hypothetical protein WC824_07720 [Bacteroidota bacterium]|jgi:hypothetical protein